MLKTNILQINLNILLVVAYVLIFGTKRIISLCMQPFQISYLLLE